ncbi:Uncharacterised protein [Burkholderia pseudomallei]|uniref:hypothetical protein n=1 Tax=Burkholderia pseudomallei TaxID=28450 RepID=UPI00016ADEB3|nr:hypothetical protein [Burkholderia pseudomallei]AUL58034.1 hypothetical protein BHT10_20780 [Burkholderia pseudomallei]MBF4031812.1 hypothetical protein [Burkholderia pseudomallei]MCW0057564.1 hypothetical protein [Burkholderia pseudomallei]MCW0163498.1 hypothetical protein [Burkholderia pseudomallei]MDV2083439.1 hypothetical protein [Burkholderia pseudomallei]
MSTIAGRSSRRLFNRFSNVPNGIAVTESGRAVYSVEPLHAEILIAHRLAYRSGDPQCAELHLYDDTLWSEVRAVLSRRPEDIHPPAGFASTP